MLPNLLLILTLLTTSITPLANPPIPGNGQQVAAGYLLLTPKTASQKLKLLAKNAATLPINRVVLSFVAPTMVYVPGSKTLKYADIGYTGGWGLWKYSIARLGKVRISGRFSSMGTERLRDVRLRISGVMCPSKLKTWKVAQAQVVKGAKGAAVKWHPEFIGGAAVKDGAGGRDPYVDLVYLAKDLGLDGVDLDYEEIWHADTFRAGTGLGPFTLDQTVYKYTAICYDIVNAIKKIYPKCKFATAAGAAGAWQGKFWGGNLKGLWYFVNLWYPDVIKFMSTGKNAGGINVMTYDVSANNAYFECPSGSTSDCDLAGQVKFYMNTYEKAGIPARVGYEVGQPAYPDPYSDAGDQLPLTQVGLTGILDGVPSANTLGGFFWELYKPKNSAHRGHWAAE
ncbi:hypothetical protein BCR33DRAFT_769966 [Rhizoclosmatium globosum]|uniref:Chitinase n=1 Tax=Rhizoclosmatium globosum TaxID=329046 RepID=A0A1Y2BQN0_9FUNG|nr:hypothetical protein BCR33DRAFT_769966 [Rhizoclosmatium globosum]|eukprot:ORY37044.1 hypothetical protein BCR33DRAFT_769966 [Rhizoclosmatium globosum]